MRLAPGWRVAPIGEVAETALGKMLDRGRPRGHSMVPYLRNVNVQWGRIDTSDLLTMELADDERVRFGVEPGDLLVCEGGEIGRAAVWRGRREYLAYQKALHRIRPGPDLDATFLRYVLEHLAVNGSLKRHATGSTIAHLPQQNLRAVRIPLPPIAEQRRIVDLLEDHLSRLDAAQRDVGKARRRLAQLRGSLLGEMIESARRHPDSIDSTVGEMSTVGTGTTPSRSNRAFYDGGTVPWITSGDLKAGLVLTANQFVTTQAVDATSLKLYPADVLIVAMYGEGKTRGTVARLGIPATTNQACAVIQPHDPDVTGWLHAVLEASYSSMRRKSAGGVQPNLNLALVRAIRIPLPPARARKALLGHVTDSTPYLARLNAALNLSIHQSELLQAHVLTAALSGRLADGATDPRVIEEPADAPATRETDGGRYDASRATSNAASCRRRVR